MGGRRARYPKQSSCPQRGSPADVNECRRPLERRVCHHSCHNTVGSFLCTCRPGFRLRADRVSCEGEVPLPSLQSATGHAPSERVPSPFTPSGHPATPSQRLALPCPGHAHLAPGSLISVCPCFQFILLLPTLSFLPRFFFSPLLYPFFPLLFTVSPALLFFPK